MLNVTLVNPPQFTRYPQPPLGLAQIAATLEKAGYLVTLLDANALQIGIEEIPGMVSSADVIGLTAMTPTITTTLDIARRIRQTMTEVKIIIGGAHVTMLPRETMDLAPEIDFIVRGEGDEAVIELMQVFEGQRAMEGVAGIAYRLDGKITLTAERTSPVDMDSLPFPAYHLLPLKKYRPHPPHGMSLPFTALVTSRGCPYHCAYCSKPVFGVRFRAQSPERVVAELGHLQNKFGVKEVAFYDDSFTLDRKRAHDICEKMLGSGMKIIWTCETRVNLVDKELLHHMKQAGCHAVAYGIESAAPEIIKVLRKDTTLEQVEEAVRYSREAGLRVIGYFMLGSPGETPDTIRQTIDLAKRLKVDFAQFSVTTPFPGTELYDIYTRDRQKNIPWDSFVYAGTDNPTTPVFESDQLSRENLKSWLQKAYREFYLRPAYFWQRLRWCTSLPEIKMNIRGLGMLLKSV